MWTSGESPSSPQLLSPSPSPSSCSSCLLPPPPPPPPRRRTMEEVWKDLGLTSLEDHDHHHTTNSESSRRTILQEFLGRPFRPQSDGLNASADPPDIGINLFSASSDVSQPATALRLSSVPEFQFLDSAGLNERPPVNTDPDHFLDASPNDPFEAIGSSLCKKRMAESVDNSGDRRNKRMIKNRESAARSRARKQAYTNELEMEVEHLMEENAKLRRQQQKLYKAVAAAQVPTKRSLHRTSTAPF